MSSTETRTVLVTGATGYIGGRLVPRLLDRGYAVVCLARDAGKVRTRPWADRPGVGIVEGDAGDATVVRAAMKGCTAAYYLIHSMMTVGATFSRHDRELAETFAHAAADAGLGQIVYLGGLGEEGEDLSEHLASRREVEEALASGPVPVTVLRAAVILGSGSASFEILRYLVERLPVMVTPRWVATACQPIAVRNVLHYLVESLEVEEVRGRTLDIGGPEVLTYRAMMETTADVLGLRHRWIVPVPVLTPTLSALWIHLVTPIPSRIAKPLADGLRHPVVCRDGEAARWMPQRLLSVRESIAAAVSVAGAHAIETAWSDAGVMPGDPDWAGGTTFEDRRVVQARCSPAAAFRAIQRVGGGHGYYAADVLWRIRGGVDRLLGGPGLRRGRRDPDRVGYGDALDFWRVSEVVPDRRLRLRAEMKLPGEAELWFEVEPESDGVRIVQTARFRPKGLLGLLYWYGVLPLHAVVFRGMLQGIRREAERPAP